MFDIQIRMIKMFLKNVSKKLNFSLVALCFALASCSNFFQGKVDMPTSESSSLVDFFKKKTVGGELKAPSKVYVDNHEFQDKIRITWEKVDGAAYYRLERAVITEKKPDGSFSEPKEEDFDVMDYTKSIYDTTYTDIIIDGKFSNELNYKNERYGYAYFYRVSAENPKEGYEASPFTTSSLAALFSPVTDVKASMGESDKEITVTWNPVDGAQSYEIYRTKEDDGANLRRIGSTLLTKYSDTSVSSDNQGKDLYYVIKALSRGGNTSVESPVALGYTKILGAPDQVKDVKVTNGRGNVTASDGIEISWSKLEGEGIKYAVYRSSSSSSTLLPLGDAEDGKTTCKDTRNLQTDTYYYYYVQAYTKDEDGTIKKSAMSDSGPDNNDPAQGFIISPPPAVVVSKKVGDSSHCMIKFTAPIGSAHYIPDGGKPPKDKKSYTYRVYAGSSESALVKIQEIPTSGETDGEGYYPAVEVGSYAFYSMTTVLGDKESARSKIVAPAPYAAQNVIVTKGAMVGEYASYKPGSVSDKKDPGSNSNGVHPVKITWQEPEGGADFYYVYRSSQRDSGYKKITDSPVRVREYVDKNDAAKPGIIYYYRVLSLNSMEQGANYSLVDAPVFKDKIIDRTQGRGWGYGALSVWQYMKEERKTVESSQKKLTLMHKPNNMDKVGSETIRGDILGTLGYKAAVQGLGARITMPYVNYADSWISGYENLGIYFLFDGDTNTTSNMSANGNMDGIVTCRGMYPGKVRYDKVEIKGGKAGGGTYGVIRDGIDSDYVEVDWKAGEK